MALVRGGIGSITIIDKDTVDITNCNRQLIADITTVGKLKVEVMQEILQKINPNVEINSHKQCISSENIEQYIIKEYNYIVDCIDCVSAKLAVIEYVHKQGIPIISCMGTGNKLDPTKFEVTDINKTSVCPLAKVIRKELRERGIQKLKVVYSKEEPIKTAERTPASISFVPPVAGFILAGEVIKDLGRITHE